MTLRIKPIHALAAVIVAALLIGVGLGELLAGGGFALAAQHRRADTVASHARATAAARAKPIHGCVNKKTHVLTVTAKCGRGSTALLWSRQGPAGSRGSRGASGAPGAAATVSIGGVSTGAPGTPATVTNGGTANAASLDFAIPQGQPGTNGSNATGFGATADGQIWMGASGAQVAPGTSHNIVGVGTDGVGAGDVDIQGCSAAGLVEPVIEVTADDDPSSPTDTVADAYVSGWSTEPDTDILVVNVKTNDLATGEATLSDFSITVLC